MAETEKKSFVLYFDTYFSISALPAEQRELRSPPCSSTPWRRPRRPQRRMLFCNQHPEMGVAARMAFSFMAKSIRRDTEKWREKHVRYQQAAQQRWQDTARSSGRRAGQSPGRPGNRLISEGGGDIWKYVRDFSLPPVGCQNPRIWVHWTRGETHEQGAAGEFHQR